MADDARKDGTEGTEGTNGGTAVIERTKPQRPRVDRLPPWKVLLHNDDVSIDIDVVNAIVQIVALRRSDAVDRMLEAHRTGVSLLVTTHRERAELLQEQLESKKLTVTIEPDR